MWYIEPYNTGIFVRSVYSVGGIILSELADYDRHVPLVLLHSNSLAALWKVKSGDTSLSKQDNTSIWPVWNNVLSHDLFPFNSITSLFGLNIKFQTYNHIELGKNYYMNLIPTYHCVFSVHLYLSWNFHMQILFRITFSDETLMRNYCAMFWLAALWRCWTTWRRSCATMQCQ